MAMLLLLLLRSCLLLTVVNIPSYETSHLPAPAPPTAAPTTYFLYVTRINRRYFLSNMIASAFSLIADHLLNRTEPLD